MRVLLVANPRAGRVNPARLAHIARLLQSARVEVGAVPASGPGIAAASLRHALQGLSPADTRVIAVGGDGTIHAILPALVGTAFPLAIVPAGTLNALAGELHIPQGIESAIRVAVGGEPRRIDVGVVNGRPFVQMAGVGFDGAAVHTVVPTENKNMLSPLVLARGLRLLSTYRPSRFRITTESSTLSAKAWLILVANASRYTYRLCASPGADIADGWLDLWVFAARSARQTVGQVLALLRGTHGGYPGVHHLRARSAQIASHPPVWLHLDGDAGGRTPAAVSVLPRALTVIVPSADKIVA